MFSPVKSATRPLLLGIALLAAGLLPPAEGRAAEEPREVRDLYYGEALYQFYQQNYYSAAVHLLTAREREVLRLLLEGASNQEIARQLVLSVNTVKKHVLNICGKFNARSRTQVIAKARSLPFL